MLGLRVRRLFGGGGGCRDLTRTLRSLLHHLAHLCTQTDVKTETACHAHARTRTHKHAKLAPTHVGLRGDQGFTTTLSQRADAAHASIRWRCGDLAGVCNTNRSKHFVLLVGAAPGNCGGGSLADSATSAQTNTPSGGRGEILAASPLLHVPWVLCRWLNSCRGGLPAAEAAWPGSLRRPRQERNPKTPGLHSAHRRVCGVRKHTHTLHGAATCIRFTNIQTSIITAHAGQGRHVAV